MEKGKMRGRLWLNYFIKSCIELSEESSCYGKKWTEFMGKIMDRVAKKMKCQVARRRPKEEEGGEYLNIDAVFIDNAEYDLIKDEENEWDPFVIPRVVVELENSYNIKKISYCLWKILCVRAPIRVLICYQKGTDKVTALKEHLEDIIWKGSLLKGTDADLLVIIGNDSMGDETPWGEYFTVFEWRNDRLEKIKG
jgi:hypothetical protein